MSSSLLLLLVATVTVLGASAAPAHDHGALDLTVFARDGDYVGAQDASKVSLGNLTSYAGFVETTPGKHMYFWYFPAQNQNPEAPLLIWLQGGPGGSSLFGLFAENGPFSIDENLELVHRPTTWNKEYGMLFIDNPVGAGFSYPDNLDTGFCTNTKVCVADNLYWMIQAFYSMFPAQLNVPLFITGESYGGHYVPAFAYAVHEMNALLARGEGVERVFHMNPCAVKVPLKGLAVGDGWIDPVNMIPAYPDMMFNLGLADELQKAKIQEYCDDAVTLIKAGKMEDAFRVWDEMLNGDLYPYANYFHNITGSNDYDNFLRTDAPASLGYYASFLNQPSVRSAMHTGSVPFGTLAHQCEINLVADFHVSLAPELVTLLESDMYHIVIYSGQLDIIIGAALTESFLQVLPWNGLHAYKTTERIVWTDSSQEDPVSGFVRSVGNFSQVIIRGAGHLAPHDQPYRTLDMINHMVKGIPFTK